MGKLGWSLLSCVALGVIGLMVKLVVFGGMTMTNDGVGNNSAQIRQSEPFKAAAQAISLDQDVLTAVGQPITFGEITVKRDTDDLVALDIQINGNTAQGHAQMDVQKPNASHGWVVKGGDFFPANGPPLHIRPQRR